MNSIKYAFFSKGHDGCLIYPGIMQKKENKNLDTKLYITKIGTDKVISNEKYIYDNLPEEFNNVHYSKECYLDDFNLDENFKHFDKNIITRINEKKNNHISYNKMMTIKLLKGNDLSNFLKNKIEINAQNVYNLLKSLIKFYNFIEILNLKYNIYHKDITSHNIIWCKETNSIFLVDFAQSKTYSPNKKPSYLPNKDLDDTLDVINSIITYSCKKFNVKILNIKTINELIKNIPTIKNKLFDKK
jgi:hypothetical protein